MRRISTKGTGRGPQALGSSRVLSALLAGVLASGFLLREVDAQSAAAGSDVECTTLGGRARFSATKVPGDCLWTWELKGNKSLSDSCGPASPSGCSSATRALAATWASGMHIRALGHATSTLCPYDAQCGSSKTSNGNLFLYYQGPASPPCNPRVRVEWSPKWNFAMFVDPPAAAVVAGSMSGEAKYTGVQVSAAAGATLNSLANPFPVQLGPISIPVTFAGNAGHFVKEVADSKSGDAPLEMEIVDWRGEVHVEVRSQISALNWSSESELRVCHSNPDLTIYAYCTECSGGAWIEYKAQS
ncbi:MAG: hypothetical protein ACREIU_04340 [Planctomycetota bacterium]